MSHIIERAMFVANHLQGDYEYFASTGCAPEGDGQCDGYDETASMFCSCPCHTGDDPLFEVSTVQEFKTAHDIMWNWGH